MKDKGEIVHTINVWFMSKQEEEGDGGLLSTCN